MINKLFIVRKHLGDKDSEISHSYNPDQHDSDDKKAHLLYNEHIVLIHLISGKYLSYGNDFNSKS